MPIPVKRSWRKRSIGSAAPPASLPLILEVDPLREGDVALVVLHDVVAVQPVAVLVEIVLALGALMPLDRQDRLADRLRVGAAGLVDGERQHGDRVEGPGGLV